MKKKSGMPEVDPKKFTRRAVTLYKAGKNVSQIAQALGYPKNHGNNRVANALIKAGVYKGTRSST